MTMHKNQVIKKLYARLEQEFLKSGDPRFGSQ
jgi:hypothetical protein